MAHNLTTKKEATLEFENKILKKVCTPIFNSELNVWQKIKMAELRGITYVYNVKN